MPGLTTSNIKEALALAHEQEAKGIKITLTLVDAGVALHAERPGEGDAPPVVADRVVNYTTMEFSAANELSTGVAWLLRAFA